jgi:hypothetical protein
VDITHQTTSLNSICYLLLFRSSSTPAYRHGPRPSPFYFIDFICDLPSSLRLTVFIPPASLDSFHDQPHLMLLLDKLSKQMFVSQLFLGLVGLMGLVSESENKLRVLLFVHLFQFHVLERVVLRGHELLFRA